MKSARIAMVLGVATLFFATRAEAGPKECITAADEGQKLRDDGKLNEARTKFIACAAKACPGPIAKQCSQWLIEADQNMPTVTFRALDDQGKETLAVQVAIDGTTVASSIEARALPIDPGEHTVRFQLADGRSMEDKVLLRPGEKNRMIELSFQPKTPVTPPPPPPPIAPPPPSDASDGFHVPLLGWVGLGVGVVGGVMTVVFATSASSKESDLRSSCAPNCDSSDKSGIDTKIALANVGLIVGVVGLGVAVVTTILANTGKPKKLDAGPGSLLLRGTF